MSLYYTRERGKFILGMKCGRGSELLCGHTLKLMLSIDFFQIFRYDPTLDVRRTLLYLICLVNNTCILFI